MKSIKLKNFDTKTMGLAVFLNNDQSSRKEESVIYTQKDTPLSNGIVKETENGKLVLMKKTISLLYDGEIVIVDHNHQLYADHEEDVQNGISLEKKQIPLEMGNLLSCLIKDQKELEADGLLVTTITRGYMKSVKKLLQKEISIFTKVK